MLAKTKKNFAIYSKKGVFTFFEDEILSVREYSEWYQLIDWPRLKIKKELLNKNISQNINDYSYIFGVLKENN